MTSVLAPPSPICIVQSQPREKPSASWFAQALYQGHSPYYLNYGLASRVSEHDASESSSPPEIRLSLLLLASQRGYAPI